MKRFSLLVVMAAVLISTTAAAGWMRTYGGEERDKGVCVRQTSDGGYIITGSTSSFGAGKDDLWLLKVDSLGDVLWTRTYGGKEDDDGEVVHQTPDDGYIVIGTTYSFGLEYFTPWVLKTDSLGDTIWTRTYDGDGSMGIWIEPTKEGAYIITGRKDHDLWLLKINSLGEIIWERTYDCEDCHWSSCVKQTSDGGYIIIGEGGEGDLGLVKTDSLGDILWTSSYGGEGADRGIYVEELDNGDYLVAGATEIEGFDFCLWLVWAYATGYIYWDYPWEGICPADGKPLHLTEDGGYILFGNSEGGIGLIKTDNGMDAAWTRTYTVGDFDYTRWVRQTSDGGYIMAGSTYYPDTEDYDLWLIKTDSLGYVEGVVEDRVVEAPDWGVVTSIGPEIVLRYTDQPQGFHAQVFDVTGRKMDEVHATGASGTITWPVTHHDFSPGVYFFRLEGGAAHKTQKVILIR